ncbi:MAG TPA: class I SAM-dependent methyltransferase [Candidatus Nanoarchaeia archaeon]|nr:class I SAM-dependent methyltransferase [Candidatus Nanoarchaeia archaeon]
MQNKYEEIKNAYDNFYRSLLMKKRLPLKDTGIGFWNAADSKTAWEILSKIGRHGKFIDLGSGDGKIVMLASQFAKKAVGIEFDSELHGKALDIARKLNIRNIELINGDFQEHSIAGYDVVFLNPDKPLHRNKVEEKLLNELTGRLVVFGPHFHPANLKKVEVSFVNDTVVGMYKNPRKNA